MIKIYKCTDCKHFNLFGWGLRIACGNPNLPANEVYKYSPIADYKNAGDCDGYDDETPKESKESD